MQNGAAMPVALNVLNEEPSIPVIRLSRQGLRLAAADLTINKL